jgi:catechol 2,3-dioxygenase-like lactoylglutathione lyase family enzyme
MSRIIVFSIPVTDPQRSKQFYSEILGFRIIRDNPMGPDRQWIQLAPSEGTATITLVTWFETMRPGSAQGIVLETSNLRRDYETLQARGLALSEIQAAPWGSYTTFQDPDGNGWVLQETGATQP